jgi:hypothetical protein
MMNCQLSIYRLGSGPTWSSEQQAKSCFFSLPVADVVNEKSLSDDVDMET